MQLSPASLSVEGLLFRFYHFSSVPDVMLIPVTLRDSQVAALSDLNSATRK